MANIAYLRNKNQDYSENLKKMEMVFTEKSPVRKRRELDKLLEVVQEGDTVFVDSFSVLAETASELYNVIKKLQQKDVNLVSRKENMDTRTENGRIMLRSIDAVAQFEQDVKKPYPVESKEKLGQYHRKKRIVIPDFKDYYDLYMKRKISKSGIALELNVSRPTVDRLVREYEESLKIG